MSTELEPIGNTRADACMTTEERVRIHVVRRLRLAQPLPNYRVSPLEFERTALRLCSGVNHDGRDSRPWLGVRVGLDMARVYLGEASMDDGHIELEERPIAEKPAGLDAQPEPEPDTRAPRTIDALREQLLDSALTAARFHRADDVTAYVNAWATLRGEP